MGRREGCDHPMQTGGETAPSETADAPVVSVRDDLRQAATLLAIGLRRALARPHNWNESVNPGESTNPVALEDQSVISAVTPANGAEEDA